MSCLRLFPRKRLNRLIACFIVIIVIFVVSVKILSQGIDQYYSVEEDVPDSSEIQFEEESDHPKEHQKEDTNLEHEFVLSALSQVGNLPDADFILQHNRGKFSNCANFPDLYRLEFNNLHWQVQNIGNLTFYLYRAYHDRRNTSTKGSIRILTMVEEPFKLNVQTVCQLWYFPNKKPLTSPASSQFVWYSKWTTRGKYTPYLVTCPIPESAIDFEQLPVSVSLIGNECDNATNNLEIVRNAVNLAEVISGDKGVRKPRFGVCVKGLDFLSNDQSFRLIEWIELLLIMGVEKIFFYEFSVHPNVKAVLEHYKKIGKIDLTPHTLPGTLPNEPGLRHMFLTHPAHASNKRKNEVIPYNDCLYRNLDKFDYLSVLDTDEIIIPKNMNSWEELIQEIDESLELHPQNSTNHQPITSYCFRNIYFFDSIPPEGKKLTEHVPSHLHMLKHIYRATNYTAPTRFIKCIHSTAKTLLIHNHFPLKCVDGPCNIHHADYRLAHMQHYRSTCVRDLKNCDEYENSLVEDSLIWKYKEDLITRVNKTISQLRLL